MAYLGVVHGPWGGKQNGGGFGHPRSVSLRVAKLIIYLFFLFSLVGMAKLTPMPNEGAWLKTLGGDFGHPYFALWGWWNHLQRL
jgi:hypothetical protein